MTHAAPAATRRKVIASRPSASAANTSSAATHDRIVGTWLPVRNVTFVKHRSDYLLCCFASSNDGARLAKKALFGGTSPLAANAFGETLPTQCPPPAASEAELVDVFRLVPSPNADDAAFASFAANGQPKPPNMEVSDCDWASCSLRTTAEALLKLKGLRKRNPFLVTLSIPAGSGKHTKAHTHINFWRYASFSLTTAVTATVPHGLS